MNSFDILIIITFVAIGTYILRISGLLLCNKLKRFKNLDIFLESIPATLLIALIIPSIIKMGIIGICAAIISIFTMYKTKSVLLSMSIGVFIVAIYRNGLLF